MIQRLLFDQSFQMKLIFRLGLLVFMLISFTSYSQTSITGKVVDEGGDALPGTTVLVEGTSIGTVADVDGKYSISVPTGASNMVFSFIGYETQVLPIGNKSVLDIALSPDAETLSEVVVIGYGTQKKSDLTGAIAGVDAQTISERGVTNAIQSLQGSLAGVQITNGTGRVGDSFSVLVRGTGTFSKGQGDTGPLYVVDGVITSNIDFLNPHDIAKIDVLKDAASAAIYGSRGSNGVVIIQTKGGVHVPKGTSISFNTFYGSKQTARLPKMMTPEQWSKYHTSAYIATVNSTVTNPSEYQNAVTSPTANPLLRERFDNLDGFDWYDAVLKSGTQSNSHINIAHRNGGSAYTLGLGYQTETGNIVNEALDKFTLRLGMDQEITSKFKTGASISLSQSIIERGSDLAMQEAFRMNPFLSPWAIDENGNEIEGELFNQPGKLLYPDGSRAIDKTSSFNPLLELANSRNETRQWNAIGNTYLQYDVLEWLSLKSTFSAGLQTSKRGQSWGARTTRGINGKNLPSSQVDYFENFNYSWDNQVNVSKTFAKHSFQLMGLQSIFVNRTDTATLFSREQPFDTDFTNVGSGPASTFNLGNNLVQSQLASFALRLNYAFNDKYLVTIANRWDGASVLADGLKWNAFPSVAVGWKLSEEAFLSGFEPLNTLKLRVSYGTTGNNNIAPYSSVNALTRQTYYDFYGTTANGWVPRKLSNKSVTWEKTKEVNVGVDFGFLNHRITGSFDYYNRLSDDILMDQNLPLETGFVSTVANAGSMRNKGVELMLTTTNFKTSLISWETTFTFTKNTNSIESINGQSENDDVGNGWFIGESINSHYNYRFDGIWQAGEDAASFGQTEGQARVLDVNDDGSIDPDDDRVILGSSDPSWTGGIISRLKVGNFDLNVTVFAKQGVLAFSNFHANFEDVRDRGRQKLAISDWYIPENAFGVAPQVSNKYPQPRNAGTYWRNDRVGYYKDASFVKINNISLGYTIPSKVLDKIKVQYMRVYVNVLNPFVFTKYDGWDPEWAEAALVNGRVSNVTTQLGLSVKF